MPSIDASLTLDYRDKEESEKWFLYLTYLKVFEVNLNF